jgi:hypothetical protein
VARALPVAGLGCAARGRARAAAHVELFARGHVVLVPAGVGIAPPLRRRGAYVTGGRCSYALRTREPTGLIELDPTRGPLTLGAFFALWGQPLSRWRLGPFAAGRGGRVEAWVDGRRWPGDPRGIPLRRHSAVVLQVQGNLPPHTGYRFPPGL